MKKTIALILTLSMMLIIFTGCSQTSEPRVPTTPTAGETKQSLTAAPVQETVQPVVETVQVPEAAPAAEAVPATVPPATAVEKASEPKQLEQKPVEEAKPEVKSDIVTFTDSMGKSITLKKNPQRVVCLYTSYLDLWDMAGGKVVGRAESKEDVPAAAKDVDTVGSYTNPNLEKILSLQPDLILLNSDLSAHTALIPMFEKSNIPYAALKYDTFKDYMKMLKIYTDLTDRTDIYQSKGVAIEKKIDAIIAKVPKSRKPSALLLLGSSKSVSVRLPNTTVGEMLQDLGVNNIAYDPNMKATDMEVFSMERVIEKNPDFIFVQTMGDIDATTARIQKDIESNPAWGYLKAVKEGKYIFLEKDLFLFKPNDRYAEAYAKLAKMLYPDIFN